ncbi:MAG: hypothetical protein Q9219_005821 [cf. Caloplaca sp. 3 TL-2023]
MSTSPSSSSASTPIEITLRYACTHTRTFQIHEVPLETYLAIPVSATSSGETILHAPHGQGDVIAGAMNLALTRSGEKEKRCPACEEGSEGEGEGEDSGYVSAEADTGGKGGEEGEAWGEMEAVEVLFDAEEEGMGLLGRVSGGEVEGWWDVVDLEGEEAEEVTDDVIAAFIATSFVAIVIADLSLLFGLVRGYEDNAVDAWIWAKLQKTPFQATGAQTKFWTPIIEGLVLALSDQQLLVGISLLIAAFLKHCYISVYHFNIVTDLAWLSSSTHLTSLNVLRAQFRESPSLRDWRVGLMLLLGLQLLIATVLEGHWRWNDSWFSPAQCLFSDLPGNYGGRPAFWSVFQVILIFFGYGASILRLYDIYLVEYLLIEKPLSLVDSLRNTITNKRSAWSHAGGIKAFTATVTLRPLHHMITWTAKLLYGAVVFFDSIVTNLVLDLAWFAYGLLGIIEDRNFPQSYIVGDENAWGFGQIVPILLLGSIIIKSKELYLGKAIPPTNGMRAMLIVTMINLEQKAGQRKRTPGAESEALHGGDPRNAHEESELAEPESVLIPPRRVDTEAGRRSKAF